MASRRCTSPASRATPRSSRSCSPRTPRWTRPTTMAYATVHACEPPEVVTIMLAANADVNQPDNDGFTPLIVACQGGHDEVVTTLLGANAAVEQAENDGATPMYHACENGHAECVQILSSYGASRTFAFDNPESDTAEHITMSATTPSSTTASSSAATGRRSTTSSPHTGARSRADARRRRWHPAIRRRSTAQRLCSSGRFGPGSAATSSSSGARRGRTTQVLPAGGARRRPDADRAGHQARQGGVRGRRRLRRLREPAAVADVFESCVIPHDIASERWQN